MLLYGIAIVLFVLGYPLAGLVVVVLAAFTAED